MILAAVGLMAVAIVLGGHASGHHRAGPVRHVALLPQPAAPPAQAAAAPAHVRDRHWLTIAEAAYHRTRAWWNPRTGWYRQFLPGTGRGAATMWGIVHLFDAASALAIADPSPRNVAAARAFAAGAERYWDPNLPPAGGYGPSPGTRGTHAWYDDEAWWAVAFFDSYRATHDRRFLADAARALAWTDSGWDPAAGGIWWDTHRTFKASESLAGATLTAAGLFQATHDHRYLAMAEKYIGWANRTIRGPDGLYGGRSTPEGPMPYVEGPMAEAELRLCKATHRKSWCAAGEGLMRATADRFRTLTMGPQYDAIYIRAVLQVYALDHNRRWYAIAERAARDAQAHAADGRGLEMRTWAGKPIGSIGTPSGKLQTHAATTSVFAWMAAARPPA